VFQAMLLVLILAAPIEVNAQANPSSLRGIGTFCSLVEQIERYWALLTNEEGAPIFRPCTRHLMI
jgi:hypothetical protein